MTDNRLAVKSTQVKEIFNSMDYNKQVQNTDLARAWLRQDNYVCICEDISENPSGTSTVINDLFNENVSVTIYIPEDNDIASIIGNKTNRTWTNVRAIEKIRTINKFVAEIEANTELICQVELLMRGILPKDTKKHGIKYVTQYLLYYSNWSYEFEKSKNQSGAVAAIISDDNSLATLGYVLALALASGSTLILQTGPRISVCASLIKQLAINSGIPVDAIEIIPGLIHPNSILSLPIGAVYIFDNVYSNNFSNLQIHPDNKIVAIANLKTSAIVFNNADIDSACTSIINAVWEYQGLLPWSVDTVIIQEDIFQNFVDTFIDKLSKLHIGNGYEQPVDISCPTSGNAVQKLQQMIDTARSQGIKVHQFSQEADGADFKPTVFVGGRVYRNNVIIENMNDIPSATVLPFRTTNEAVSLASNGRQGLAVSVWSQNIDLVNEVAQKVEVGTVWVNCHGIVKVDVSFEPRKGSGLGYFGGPEGFYECIDNFPIITPNGGKQTSPVVNGLVAAAKKAQQTWSKLSKCSRIQKLSNWALEIDNNKGHWESELSPELWIAGIYDSFSKLSRPGSSIFYEKKYYLSTHNEPLGIVALQALDEDAAFIKTVTGALYLGNAVIIVTDDKNLQKYSLLSKSLSPQLIFICKDSDFHDIVNHKDINTVISKSSPRAMTLVDFKKIYAWQDDWSFVLRRATQIKNIWFTVGESFL